MITMAEIARLTHVSQPTVSRVLNGNPKVSPEIRERVLACAREHDYQLNALAKGLQGSRTHLLGVLVTDISNGFFAGLAKQIEIAARERGYSILLFNSDYNPENEQEYLDVVRRYRVDGILAVPIRETSAEWHDYVKKLDAPGGDHHPPCHGAGFLLCGPCPGGRPGGAASGGSGIPTFSVCGQGL